MPPAIIDTPIHEAELFLGEEAQHLENYSKLYHAYTKDNTNHLSLYIGQDVATLLANPSVQRQITSKLHSTPNLLQIKITPQKEMFVANLGTNDFQQIDFEEDSIPPEVSAIAEKSQRLYLQMQPHLVPPRAEELDLLPREWSSGYPPPASAPNTAQLHERIHFLESQLATERLQGDMQKIKEEIRENRVLLLELLRAREAGFPANDQEINTLRRQLEITTGQIDRLIEQARDRGLAHSAEMDALFRENAHLRRDCWEMRNEIEGLAADNNNLRRAYRGVQDELGELHEDLQNLRRLERTIDTLREREGLLQEALEVDLPEDMLAKVFELSGENVHLRNQLNQTEKELDRYRDINYQATKETQTLRHQISRLNFQYQQDKRTIQRLLKDVRVLEDYGEQDKEQIDKLRGQLKAFHDRLFSTDHVTAVTILDRMTERLKTLEHLESSLQNILNTKEPEDIIKKVLALTGCHRELGDALQSAQTLRDRLKASDLARQDFERDAGDLRVALQNEKKTTASLRYDLTLEQEKTARLSNALRIEKEKSADLLEEKNCAQRALIQATDRAKQLDKRLIELTKQLHTSEQGLKKEKGISSHLGIEKAEVEKKLGLANREKEQLGEQLDKLTKQLKTSEETSLGLNREIEKLGKKVKDLERKNATLLKQKNEAQEALVLLKSTHEQTKTNLLHVEAELFGERDNVLRAEKQSDSLRREFSAEKRKLQDQVRNLTDETTRLGDALRIEKEKSADLLEEKNCVQKALIQATDRAKQLDKQLIELTKQLHTSEQGLKKEREISSHLGIEKAEVEKKLGLANREKEQLGEQLDKLTKQLKTSEETSLGLNREIGKLGKRVKNLERKNVTLLNQRNEAQKDLALLKSTHEQTKTNLLHVEAELLGERENVLRAEKQSDSLRREFSAEKRKLQDQALNLTDKIERGKGELKTLTQKFNDSQGDLEANQTTISLLKEDLRKAQDLAKLWEKEAKSRDNSYHNQSEELKALQEEHQCLLLENHELSSAHQLLQKEKFQLEKNLWETNQQLLNATTAINTLEQKNEEQQTALSSQKQEIKKLSTQLAQTRLKAENQDATYKKQVAELSSRLDPDEAHQLRSELATQKNTVLRLNEELRNEREKATTALKEVSRRASPQQTYEKKQTIQRLEKELQEANSKSEELASRLSTEASQRLENQSQHEDEVLLLRDALEKLQTSLTAAERQIKERLAPEEEKDLREQLRTESDAVSQLTTNLLEANRKKDQAKSDVQNLEQTLKSRGSLSQIEIDDLKSQLQKAKEAALLAGGNAAKSEGQFQEVNGNYLKLQNEVLLLKELNSQLQTNANDATALREILKEITTAVNTSEGSSALPGIVRQKVADLQEKHALLETLSNQIIGPEILARQMGQVKLSMLPLALSNKLEEVERLRKKHEKTVSQINKKDEEILLLRQELGEARNSLRGHIETKETLQEKETELEHLTESAERTERMHQEQFKALNKEVSELKACVNERQSVVEEFYNRMVSAETQRDATVRPRDTAQLAVLEKDAIIKKFSRRIDELEDESISLRKEVERRGKTINSQLIELREQQERLGEQDTILEDNLLEINQLKRTNRDREERLRDNEKELADLRHELKTLQEATDPLKDTLERIAAVLDVPSTTKSPEELSTSLEGRIREIKASRNQLQEAFDTHIQYLEVAKSTIEDQQEEIKEMSRAALAQRKELEHQIQTSLKASEKRIEERLSPEAEKALRSSLLEANETKDQAEKKVQSLVQTLESRGSLSQIEIDDLKSQLQKAQGAALRAGKNAEESEKRFQEVNAHYHKLQDKVLLLEKLNLQLQSNADDNDVLKKVLGEIAAAVGTSEGALALPNIVGQTVAELQKKHSLLEMLSDQIIGPTSFARQTDQVELSMLPQTLSNRLNEIALIEDEYKETVSRLNEKSFEVSSLRQELGEAQGSLFGYSKARETLRQRELELETLTHSAKKTEQTYKSQVADLKREAKKLKDTVAERQSVIDEDFQELYKTEQERDTARKQRDATRRVVTEKEDDIRALSDRINELESESSALRKNLERSEKDILRQSRELQEKQELLDEQDSFLDNNGLETRRLKCINSAQRSQLEENEKDISKLRQQHEENDHLKEVLERITAVLNVPSTIEDPEELAASLEGRIERIKASRNQLQEDYNTHIQYLKFGKLTIENQQEEIEGYLGEIKNLKLQVTQKESHLTAS